MRAMAHAITLLFLAILTCDSAPAVQPASTATGEEETPMSAEAIDAYLDKLFQSQKKLEYFTANIRQVKKGGIFKRAVEKAGSLAVRLPKWLLLDLSEDGLKIIVDGTFAWIHDTDLDDVERWRLESKGTARKDFDIAAFFLGSDVKTAGEIRREFDILGWKRTDGTRLLLTPTSPEMAEKTRHIELVFPEGGLIPTRVVTTGATAPDSPRPPLVTTQELSEIRTNLDGLAHIPADRFRFQPADGMAIRAMNGPRGPRDLTPEEARKSATPKQETTP